MDETKFKRLFKVELGDCKGCGEIVLIKPLSFPIGKIQIGESYSEFDAKRAASGSEPSMHIEYCIDEESKFEYEQKILLYDAKEFLAEMEFGYNAFGPYAEQKLDVLRKIIKAKNLNLQIKSKKRKNPDVRWEGVDVVRFQQAIEAMLDLVSNPEAFYQYIAKNDDSFDELVKQHKERLKKERLEREKEKIYKEKEKAAEARTKEAKKQINNIWLVVLSMSIGALVAGIFLSSSKLCWLGVAGVVISVSAILFIN